MKQVRFASQEFQRLINRQNGRSRIVERVRKIVEGVRTHGDEGVIRFTRQFDKVRLTPKQLRVTETEINGAYQNLDPKFAGWLKIISENIGHFYKRHLKKSWRTSDQNGVVLGELYRPLDRVGVYIPSGTAPLVSTVYMTIVPARLAGVSEIYVATPPRPDGSVDPHILAVAGLLKVNGVFKIGGAQAIAAMAFGTRTIPQVDKIVGPGNLYVAEAKRQVFGHVDIDMVAGPSEVVIIANQHCNVPFLLEDLRAQAEHFMGMAVVVTPSKMLVRQLRQQTAPGFIIHTKNLNEAVDIVNRIAPEHVQIMVKRPQALLRKIRHAGTVFLGPYTPTAVGDYVAGPSHVLPTGGTARFFSGLSVEDFIKRIHVIGYSRKALEASREMIERIGTIESMTHHVESVRVRFIDK